MHATPDLSRAAVIDALIGTEKRLAQLHAAPHRLLAALAQSRTADPLDCTEEEITAALRWSPNTTRNRLHTAHSLATRFPETLDLMAAGSVSNAQANALVEITAALEPDAARAAQNRVLARLPHQSVAATRKALHRAVLAVDPQAAHKRHRLETKKRRVTLCPEPDGMATLALYTPAQPGAAVMAALDLHARQRSEGDARSLDQRRADSLAHLVLSSVGVPSSGTTQTTAEVPALIQITVGIDTLLGSSEEPAELRGIGPITAGQARAIAFGKDATWRRLLTAPDGTLLHADARTYKPPASVQRLVRLRDRHCTFPGCAMPAARCDLDHIVPFDHHRPEDGGATAPQNLHALCRRRHRLKTAGSWKVAREGEGEVVWSAPTGHGYSTRADAYAA